MKMKISYESDVFEETDNLKIISHSFDMYSSLHEARNLVRGRLKYGEMVSSEEEVFLDELMEILYVEGVEL